MEKFKKDYRISLRDMGLNFRTKTTTLLHDFQECFAQLCLEKHITGYDLDKLGLMWVVANINLEILEELPIWDSIIRIETWFSEVKKIRAYLEFRIYHGEKEIAHGDSLWFVLDQKTRKPVAIDKIIESCGKSDETVFETHKRVELNKDDMEKISESNYIVNYNDLDYNGHVNNISYLDWAIMSVPADYIKNHLIKKYSITFSQECFLNENLKTVLYQKDTDFNFEVIKKDNTIACKIDISTELI